VICTLCAPGAPHTARAQVGDGSKGVPVNSTIAIIGEEGDDLSGADALAADADTGAAASEAPKEEAKEAPKEEPKKEESKPAPPKEESKPEPQQLSAPRAEGSRIFASPLAKRLAQEQGIPLAQVKGTGPSGRIVKADIEAFKPSAAPAAPAKSAPAPAASSSRSSAPAPSAPAPASADYTDSPVSNMRRVIASRLTESKQQLPHYYVSIDVEMDRVLKLRQAFNDASEKKAGADKALAKAAKLSVGDFITKAAGVALREVPEVNASWMGDFVRR
jgi:pyruvate dehydrogenase E2 component (dihydrolipoamide acetyltransferase)